MQEKRKKSIFFLENVLTYCKKKDIMNYLLKRRLSVKQKKKPPGGGWFWQAVSLVGAIASIASLIISLVK